MRTRNIFKSGRRGFTLIELLIAAAIFSVIAVSIYSVLRAGVKLWYKTGSLIQINQSARFFFNTISSDLKNSVAYLDNGTNFEGEAQKMSFMTLVNSSGQGTLPDAELAKVTYYFDRKNRIVNRVVATGAEGFSGDFAVPEDILEDIDDKDFSFEYCYKKGASLTDYDYEWKDSWEDEDRDRGRIPRGVKVKAGGYDKTIFIPTGSLGGVDEAL